MEYTEEQYKAAARRAYQDGNIGAAQRLIASARNAAQVQATQPTQAPPNNFTIEQQQAIALGNARARLANANQQPKAEAKAAPEALEINAPMGGAPQMLPGGSVPSLTPGSPGGGQGAEMNLRSRRAAAPGITAQTIRDNIFGDNDDSTMNFGERTAAALNKAGESMTLGLVGDEAGGLFDQIIGRGNASERTQFYRDQEAQLDEQHPVLSTSAAIAGGLIGPGKGMANFVNAGRSTGTRIGRGSLLGGGMGATYGAMEGETADGRTQGAMSGGLMGATIGGGITGLGQGFNAAAQRLSRSRAGQEVTATVESLTDEARALYAGAERAGGSVSQEAVQGLASNTKNALRSAGYHPRLHPRMQAVLDEMDELSTGPANMRAMDQLRRIAGNASQSLQKDEQRLGGIVMGQIDDVVEGMTGGAEVTAAREVWGRLQRMSAVEGVIEKASNARDFEGALATGFRQLLNRKGGTRGFTKEQIAAMRQIASEGGSAGALRKLGGMLSPDRLSGLLTTGGAIAALASPAALALPVAGAGMRMAGNRMTQGRAQRVLENTGRSAAHRKLLEQITGQRANPLAGLGGAAAIAEQ